MASILFNNKLVEFTEFGFLINREDWSEELAEMIANQEKINELTGEHWIVIHYLRNYANKYGISPLVSKICKDTGYSLRKLYDLFPTGPSKGASKIAGLSMPSNCY